MVEPKGKEVRNLPKVTQEAALRLQRSQGGYRVCRLCYLFSFYLEIIPDLQKVVGIIQRALLHPYPDPTTANLTHSFYHSLFLFL